MILSYCNKHVIPSSNNIYFKLLLNSTGLKVIFTSFHSIYQGKSMALELQPCLQNIKLKWDNLTSFFLIFIHAFLLKLIVNFESKSINNGKMYVFFVAISNLVRGTKFNFLVKLECNKLMRFRILVRNMTGSFVLVIQTFLQVLHLLYKTTMFHQSFLTQ